MSSLASQALELTRAVGNVPPPSKEEGLKHAYHAAVTGKKHPVAKKEQELREFAENKKGVSSPRTGVDMAKSASNFFTSRLRYAKSPMSSSIQNVGRQFSTLGSDVRVGGSAMGLFEDAIQEGLL